MNDNGYIGKKYILSFILIFSLLLLFLFIFFYFNLYLVLFLVFVILICVIVFFATGREKKEVVDNIYNEEDLERKIQERNEDFSLDLFYLYVRDVIELVSRGYSKNTTSFLIPFIGKDLQNQINTNIESYKQNDFTRMITSINIRDIELTDYYISKGYEYFVLEASISKVDCKVQNGVVIGGFSDNGKFIDYKLILCRNIKEYTPNVVNKCPLCGGTSFNNGKCLNCSQLVINEDGYYLIKLDEF